METIKILVTLNSVAPAHSVTNTAFCNKTSHFIITLSRFVTENVTHFAIIFCWILLLEQLLHFVTISVTFCIIKYHNEQNTKATVHILQ